MGYSIEQTSIFYPCAWIWIWILYDQTSSVWDTECYSGELPPHENANAYSPSGAFFVPEYSYTRRLLNLSVFQYLIYKQIIFFETQRQIRLNDLKAKNEELTAKKKKLDDMVKDEAKVKKPR